MCKTKLTSAGVASSYKSESYPSIATNNYDVNYRLKYKKNYNHPFNRLLHIYVHLIKSKFIN